MLDLSSMNDLIFPGLPPVNNDRRFVTASKTIHNETVPTPSIPQGFADSNAYLRHLVNKGAAFSCWLIPQKVIWLFGYLVIFLFCKLHHRQLAN